MNGNLLCTRGGAPSARRIGAIAASSQGKNTRDGGASATVEEISPSLASTADDRRGAMAYAAPLLFPIEDEEAT